MSIKRLQLFCAASIVVIAAVGPANAQSSQSRDEMDALKAQINALQQEVRELRGKVNKAEQTAQKAQAGQKSYAAAPGPPKAPPTPPPTAVAKMSPAFRPSICSVDGGKTWVKAPVGETENCIALTSRLHFDVGGYDYRPNTLATVPQNLDSGVNARRARIGVLGTFMADWNYALIFDFGGSSDGFGGTVGSTISSPPGGTVTTKLLPGGITSAVENAYLSYQGIKGLAIEGGYIDSLYTLDNATSSNDIMFLERASAGVIANNIAANDFRSMFGARAYGDWYWAGAYVTGPTSGAMHSATSGSAIFTPPDGTTEQLGGFARVALLFGDPKLYSFHIGADVEALFEAPYDFANGSRSLAISDRPEVRIDPTEIVGAVNIQNGSSSSIANVSHAQVYSVEAAGNWGPLYFQGEYFWFNVDRRPFAQPGTTFTGPTLHFNGGYAEASWVVTGETRSYDPGAGAYAGVVPDNPFSWANGGWGAWEIAGRYSVIDLNDRLGFVDGVAGGKQTIYTVGLNWYVNRNIRFMLDYLHGIIDKRNGPTGPFIDQGARFDAVAMRTQIAF